ncbi:hypothetical protein B0J12DRAFT_196111 [Macrophomina phaseolina]|uniref:Uncharacterized protein n=1 Tax=Macrophomina phaseolina TaxID=35725 RepID=A0ABQ8G2U2_9PEZI|nr:hypothetical protein B0J12DRAFT_196111 [Macrophomina phaseolina]
MGAVDPSAIQIAAPSDTRIPSLSARTSHRSISLARWLLLRARLRNVPLPLVILSVSPITASSIASEDTAVRDGLASRPPHGHPSAHPRVHAHPPVGALRFHRSWLRKGRPLVFDGVDQMRNSRSLKHGTWWLSGLLAPPAKAVFATRDVPQAMACTVSMPHHPEVGVAAKTKTASCPDIEAGPGSPASGPVLRLIVLLQLPRAINSINCVSPMPGSR